MPVGDLHVTRFLCWTQNQIGLNIRYWSVAAFTGTEATPSQIAQGMDTAFNAAFKALLSAGANYRGVGDKRITGVPSIEYSTIANAGVGAVAGDILPLQIAGLISLYSIVPGKVGRGRVYVPFPSEADSTVTGAAQASYVTRLQTLAALFIGTVICPGTGGNTTMSPVLYNRKTHAVTSLIGGTTFSHQLWATQRRRGGYGKANLFPF